MRILPVALIYLSLIVSCGPSGKLPTGVARVDEHTLVTDVSRDDGFLRSEQIWVEQASRSNTYASRVGIDPVSQLPYKYFPDRSVWIPTDNLVSCNSDLMSDRRTCELSVGFANLAVRVATNGSILGACAPMHDFPGRQAAFRVDKHPMITSDQNGCISSSAARTLVGQMKAGKTLYVKTVRWPDDFAEVQTTAISGTVDLALRIWQFTNSADLSASLFEQDTSEAHKLDVVQRNGQ